MKGIKQKCFGASVALHLLLLLALFATPAFLRRPEPTPNFAAMTFVSSDAIKQAMAATSPSPPARVTAPEAMPEPPAPKPTFQKPESRPEPAPPVETPKPTKPEIKVNPDLKRVEPKEITKRPPEPATEDPATSATTTKPVKTQRKEIRTSQLQAKASTDDDKRTRKQRELETAEREKQEVREWIARERSRQEGLQERSRKFAETAEHLRSRAATGSDIGMTGTSGDDVFANWYSQLKTVYERAWEGRRRSTAIAEFILVKAVVTIARDGTVLAYKVIEPSGIPAVDASVDRVLRDLRKVPPFPAGASEAERKVVINFKVEG